MHFVEMIACHHDPSTARENYEHAAIIHVADWLAWEYSHPSVSIASAPQLDQTVKRWMRLPDEQWDGLETEFRMCYAKCAEIVKMMV